MTEKRSKSTSDLGGCVSYRLDIWPSPCAATKTINYSVVSYWQGADGPQHIKYLTDAVFGCEQDARDACRQLLKKLESK